jgi:hypothetical protein
MWNFASREPPIEEVDASPQTEQSDAEPRPGPPQAQESCHEEDQE